MKASYDFEELFGQYTKKGWNLTDPKPIKTGKDASVYQVLANNQPAALKIYHHEKNHSNNYYLEYTNIQKIPGSYRRAIKSGNKIGKQLLQKLRVMQEYKMLKTFYNQGLAIPEPLETALDTILMELIGQFDQPAPQLNNINLSQVQAQEVLDTILDCMETMLKLDIIHGDLSAFNILWFENRPFIIDFPQAINLREHTHPKTIFDRDLANICNYFGQFLELDVAEICHDFEPYFEFI